LAIWNLIFVYHGLKVTLRDGLMGMLQVWQQPPGIGAEKQANNEMMSEMGGRA
jgi:hypothetical protein